MGLNGVNAIVRDLWPKKKIFPDNIWQQFDRNGSGRFNDVCYVIGGGVVNNVVVIVLIHNVATSVGIMAMAEALKLSPIVIAVINP